MTDSQEKWDRRWQEKQLTANWQPDPWLKKVLPLLPPRGTALDIACGLGRNSLFLAEQGYQVTAVDISPVALHQLTAEAERRQLSIECQQFDLETTLQLPPGRFELLLNFFYLHRPLLPQQLAQVAPGGVLVARTFSSAGGQKFGSVRPEISLHPGELLEIFSDWQILLHEEGLEPSAKGGSLAGIVARKPN